MRKIINLSDLDHIPTPSHSVYSASEMEEARQHWKARGLRFNNANGVVSDRDGWKSRPSNPSEHVPAETEEEVMQYQFRNSIANSASRKARGFSL